MVQVSSRFDGRMRRCFAISDPKPKDSNPVTTLSHSNAISKQAGIACLPKPNGNMQHVPVPIAIREVPLKRN